MNPRHLPYNDCEYIREMYKNREVIITNFDPKKMVIKDFSFQMNLFSDLEDEDEQLEFYLKED